MIATLLMLCYLPQPTFNDPSCCDVIVLNHTCSAGWRYSQLVMITDNRIVNVDWKPTFGVGTPKRWMLMSEVSDCYLVTVTDSYGEVETWKAPTFVEAQTQNNDWMKAFCEDEQP